MYRLVCLYVKGSGNLLRYIFAVEILGMPILKLYRVSRVRIQTDSLAVQKYHSQIHLKS